MQDELMEGYAENPQDTAVFDGTGPEGQFFWKKKKFRYGLEECVYQISGLYTFSFGQGVWNKPTDMYRSKEASPINHKLNTYNCKLQF